MSHLKSVTPRQSRGYTLVELIITTAILGTMGALVVPAMSQTGVLRVQTAVRAVIADITFAQSDALAYQARRAVVFDVQNNLYTVVEVNGAEIDIENDALYNPGKFGQKYVQDFTDDIFGGASLASANIDGDGLLIFDELGGPVLTTTGNAPSAGGTIDITGSGSTYQITIEAFTGRISVEDTTPDDG